MENTGQKKNHESSIVTSEQSKELTTQKAEQPVTDLNTNSLQNQSLFSSFKASDFWNWLKTGIAQQTIHINDADDFVHIVKFS